MPLQTLKSESYGPPKSAGPGALSTFLPVTKGLGSPEDDGGLNEFTECVSNDNVLRFCWPGVSLGRGD